jgi:hypothetical protein
MTTYLSFARQEVVTLMVRFVEIAIRQGSTESREHVWRRMAIVLSHNAVRATHIAHSIRELTQVKATAGVIEFLTVREGLTGPHQAPMQERSVKTVKF